MKKVLFGTTALVAASVAGTAFAAEGLSYGVGGYSQLGVEFNSGNDVDADGIDDQAIRVVKEMEVHFSGSTTLDNGLTVGGKVEIEGYAGNSGDQIDENMVYVSGSFGRLELGGEDSAAYNLRVWVPGSYVGHGVDDPNMDNNGTYIYTSSYMTSDHNKITYITPSFSGFQAGISYTPQTGVDGNAAQESSGGDADNDNTDSIIHDAIQIGAAYSNSFGDVSFKVSGEYGTASRGAADVDEWGAGLSLGFSGFTIAGAYSDREETADRKVWAVGGSYSTGPWTVGLGYGSSEVVSTDVETTKIAGGVNYALGAGATVGAGFDHGGTDGGDDNTTFGIMLGLSF